MPADAMVILQRIYLSVGDKLRNRLGGERWVHHHDIGYAANARDRYDVTQEIEIQFVVERRVDGIRRADHEQRVAVGGRAHHCFRRDIAAGSRLVFDDERLAQMLRQPLVHQAR
jgi:hypothetical protein